MDLDHEQLSRGIVGCCIARPALLADFSRWLQPRDLKGPWNVVMEALIGLSETIEGPVDLPLLAAETAKKARGIDPVKILEASFEIPGNFEEYSHQLRQRARLAIWWRAAVRIQQAAGVPDRDVAEEQVHEALAVAHVEAAQLLAGPAVLSGHDLLAATYHEPKWAVPDLIPAGLTLFAGPPKVGKSAIILDVAVGVATGGRAMSHLYCEKGAVLYLSLDNDTERRLQMRMRKLLGGEGLDPSAHIDLMTDWPTGHRAIAECQQWVDSVENPLLVVVDTLVKAEPDFEGNGNQSAYVHSTQTLTRWSRFANDNGIAVVMIHHDRKSEADDWLNRFAGSRGITATAQTLLMLDAKRGSQDGLLRVSGRDVVSDEFALSRWSEFWSIIDIVQTVKPEQRSPQIQERTSE